VAAWLSILRTEKGIAMKAVLDGIIYETQSRGGISRLYSEILPRICAMEESLNITLLTANRPKQPLPTHPQIVHRSYISVDRVFRPWRLWAPAYPKLRSLVLGLAWGLDHGSLWHSTYYTMRPRWTGPKVVTVVDMIHERFSHLFSTPADERFRQRKRRCILGADKVICISHTTEQEVQEFLGIPSDRTEVVALACSNNFGILESDAESSVIPTEDPYLLYVGTRSYHKNFSLVLEAYSGWNRRNEFSLITVGVPWSNEETQCLHDLGLSGRVYLLSDTDDDQLCQLYNRASAFIYPSLFEGFGIPLLEAMACGCPIVASRIPSTLEVAKECPIYFEPTEPDDLVRAFDLAISEGRDSERVRAGLQAVRRYSWDETARQTLEVYRAVSKPD
jgi:glycosyltransferase involved in cell wall biosynthesis